MRLTDLLPAERVRIPLEADTRDEAIHELIDVLEAQVNDKEAAYQAVLEREKIMTTGVGNGIAIPHCKHASCPNFAIAMGVCSDEIDFSSIDKKPVRIIFLLVGPENNPGLHIKLLSRISRLMSNEQLRARILECETPAEAHKLIREEENNFFEIG